MRPSGETATSPMKSVVRALVLGNDRECPGRLSACRRSKSNSKTLRARSAADVDGLAVRRERQPKPSIATGVRLGLLHRVGPQNADRRRFVAAVQARADTCRPSTAPMPSETYRAEPACRRAAASSRYSAEIRRLRAARPARVAATIGTSANNAAANSTQRRAQAFIR